MKTLFTLLLLCFLVNVSAQVSANAGPDKEICIMDTLKITGTGLNAGDTGSYQWKDLNANMVVSTGASFATRITSMTSRNYALTVTRITNGNTYYAYDTMLVTVNALPAFVYKGIPPRCYRDGAIHLTLSSIATAKSGDGTVSDTAIRYYQPYKTPSWVTGGPAGTAPFVYDFTKFVANEQVPKTGLRDTICYEYRDYKGCYNKECSALRLNPNPVVETVNGVYCQRAGKIILNKLVAKPFSKVGGIESFRCLSVPQGSGVNANTIITVNTTVVPNSFELDPGNENEPSKAGEYIIEYCFKDALTGCQSCDTSTVHVVRLPVLKFPAIPKQCINGPLLALDSLVTNDTGGRLTAAKWETVEYNHSRDMSDPTVGNRILNSVKNQKDFDPSAGTGDYLVKVTDTSSGCPVSDSFNILVNGLPVIQIDLPDTVCSNDSVFIMNNIAPTGPVGTWSGQGVDGRNFVPSTFVSGSFMNSSRIRYTYTHPATGCTSSDSQTIWVQNPADFQITATPRPKLHYRVDFNLSNLSNIDTLNGKFLWDFGATTSTSPNPKNIFFADSGTHTVYVTADYGTCQTVKAVTFTLDYITVDIDDLQRLVRVHPNPVHDVLTVQMPFDARLLVSDMNGKQVSVTHHAGGERSYIQLDGITSGIYLLTVEYPEGLIRKKIVVE